MGDAFKDEHGDADAVVTLPVIRVVTVSTECRRIFDAVDG